MSVYTIVDQPTNYAIDIQGSTEITIEVQDDSEIQLIQIGTQGPVGPQGPAGVAGANGTNGTDGADGADGADGPPIVNTSSYSSPTTVSGAITVPSDQRAQLFIQGAAALTTISSLTNGSGTQELYLVGTNDLAKLELPKSALSNVQLSGVWYAAAGSMLKLHWISGLNKWLEAYRNEI